MSETMVNIADLDAQIDASTDVSEQDKQSKRELLRRLFHLGNECRARGVSEEFLRQRIPFEATPIMVGSWETTLPKRIDALCKLWARKN